MEGFQTYWSGKDLQKCNVIQIKVLPKVIRNFPCIPVGILIKLSLEVVEDWSSPEYVLGRVLGSLQHPSQIVLK